MKKIEWNTKKRWKVVQILFCLVFLLYFIWACPQIPGAESLLFSGVLGAMAVIGFSIADILKSKENEKEELKCGLKSRIATHEKELEELKKELEELG